MKIAVYNTTDHAGLLQRLKELLHGKLLEEYEEWYKCSTNVTYK